MINEPVKGPSRLRQALGRALLVLGVVLLVVIQVWAQVDMVDAARERGLLSGSDE